MKNKKSSEKNMVRITIISLALFILVLNLLQLVNSEASIFSSLNVCCEKTINGAWCQNTLEENCDANFRKTPTSCEATSFCRQGCCYDSDEGLCMESTPEKVCQDSGGVWDADAQCSIPQCDLGCCVLGNQASFVSLVRCKKLSSFYGLNTDFRKNIEDELSCIAVAQSQDMGACVFEVDFQKTCRFTTRGDCTSIQGSEFFKDYLCSAEELGTNCGKTTKTMCVPGKDEVYFQDSCGNPANIYDATKKDDNLYWKNIVSKEESCKLTKPGSSSCGNCDYFKGSICSDGKATYGTKTCKDLNCYNVDINGKKVTKKNGESWCVYDGKVGGGADSVGSRHFRYVCINGEVTSEPCEDFRNEICFEAKIDTSEGIFTESACRVNRWTDCLNQKEEEDCLNTDQRDCYWLKGVRAGKIATTKTKTQETQTFSGGTTGGFSGGLTGSAVAPITGMASDNEEKPSGVQLGGGICLPEVSPGLMFWNQGDASSICSFGNSQCIVIYEEKIIGGGKCVENCECLESSYLYKMNQVCTSLGDCGAYVNWQGKYVDNGAEWKVDGKKKDLDAKTTIGLGLLNDVKKKAGV